MIDGTKEDSAIVTIRPPRPEDAASVHEAVVASRTLEPNTTYAYVLLCTHFSATCAIAECGGRVAGVCLAYRIPERPTHLFVWQIGVHPDFQRRGIAKRLLDDLARRNELSDITTWELSIAPSNAASTGLFRSWANARGVEMRRSGQFSSSLFGAEGAHEPEDVFEITPIRGKEEQ